MVNTTSSNVVLNRKHIAAVSCSPDEYRLGGAGLGFWLTGKLGSAWVSAWVGAWVGAWVVHGWVHGLVNGWW